MQEKVTRWGMRERVSPFLAWGDFHARSHFARSTIPEEKWGTTRSLTQCSVLGVYGMSLMKTLDNNDLNQVGHPAVLVKTRVWVGCSVSRAHKTWTQQFIFKDFLPPKVCLKLRSHFRK